MSGRRSEKPDFQPVVIDSGATHLALSTKDVHIRKNGIEFFSPTPFAQWREMTVQLELAAADEERIECAGVVVACEGNPHTGYTVSLVFTNVSPQNQAALNRMAYSALE